MTEINTEGPSVQNKEKFLYEKLKTFRIFDKHPESAMKKLLINKEIIETADEFVKCFSNSSKGKIFLVALLVHYYPHNVDNNEVCVALAFSLRKSLNSFDLRSIRNYVILFERKFNEFLQKDKEEIIKVNSQVYSSVASQKSILESFGQSHPEMENFLNKLSSTTKKIYGVDITKEKILSGDEVRELLEKEIQQSLEKAYIDFLKSQIQEENYVLILQNLGEIKENVRKLVSFKDEKLVKDIDEYIDLEFIETLMIRGVYTRSNFIALIKYILNLLSEIANMEKISSKILTILETGGLEMGFAVDSEENSKEWMKLIPFTLISLSQRISKIVVIQPR